MITEQRAKESDGRERRRVLAESEGVYRERVNRHCETLGIQIVKANSIFKLPSYACIHKHFFIGKGHVCFASVAQRLE